MEECKIKNLYNLEETIASEIFEGATYPWEVLLKINDFIIELGNTLDKEEYKKIGEDVWIAKSATVAPTAYIKGPAIIGKNAILFNKVQVPHYNYVGDSILGYKSHMGAGSITSNVKSDKKLVVIKNGTESIETGLKKVGAMIGDEVEVGCGCVLNPGTIIGRNSNIYPLSSVRKIVPTNSIYKNQNEIVEKN